MEQTELFLKLQENGNHLLDCPTDEVQDGLFAKPDFGEVCLFDSEESRVS